MDSRDAKRKLLQQVRGIHGNPERVRSTLFHSHPFFDAEDKAQVKYEMLRRREVERAGLVETCRQFGFTRESYRQILERFRAEGMFGLFDRKRGRKNPLKIGDKVQAFLCREHTRMPELGADELAARCEKEMGVSLSRRSVYRVLSKVREEKKKRHRKASSAH